MLGRVGVLAREPWGTPMFMGRVSDTSLIAVCWVLSVRHVLNNFKGICHLSHRVQDWQEECHDQQYQMPSESQKRLHKLFFHHLFIAFWIFSVMLFRIWFVKWWFLKLNWNWSDSYYCLRIWRGIYVWVFNYFTCIWWERLVCNYCSLVGLLFWR